MNIELPNKISTEFIYACMGFGSKTPDCNSIKLIRECSEIILSSAYPREIHMTLPLGVIDDSLQVYILSEKNMLKGQDIKNHLKGCNECVLMAITLGIQVDKVIRKMQVLDMGKAVALDACASSLVEDLCEKVNQQILEELKLQKKYLTSRFSPGYGDLPLATQNIFSNLLEMEKKIGLTQNSEHLLLPRKSITAIMGILPIDKDDNVLEINAKNLDSVCDVCPRKNDCIFRKNGGHCGKIL